MDQDLADRHVVVTGGAGVLGGAVVEHLLARGATCHVPAHEAVPARAGALDHPRVEVIGGVDLTDEAAVARYYAAVPAPWASIHLAGGFAAKPALDTGAADLRAMFEMNALTCFLACREAIRRMRGAGGGRIVNVAARPALVPTAGLVAYAASKAAVAALTQALAAEEVAADILINAVVPSVIDSPANRRAMPNADHDRWPTPAEVAAAIGSLVAPANRLTWGALVPVYGRG